MNSIHTETRYILKFDNDVDGQEKAWVDLDSASGGYPYGVNNPLNAYNFSSIEKALNYAKMFTNYPLKIKQEVFKIEIKVYLS